MKNNFFRKDLNLKNRWWHRFLFIFFILSFVVFTIYNIMLYSVSDMFRGGSVQQWSKVDALSERITPEINSIGAYIKLGEKVAEDDRVYVLNDRPDEYYKGVINDVYCSTNLADNIIKIKNIRKINNLFIRDLYGTRDVSLGDFQDYIKQNNIYCMIVDAYTKYDVNGQIDGKLSFLEPDRAYQNNWSFYKKSTSKTILYFIEMVPIILAVSFLIFAMITTIYYKIVLYIIFGNKKNE